MSRGSKQQIRLYALGRGLLLLPIESRRSFFFGPVYFSDTDRYLSLLLLDLELEKEAQLNMFV